MVFKKWRLNLMVRLNVQVRDDLLGQIVRYAHKYRITRSAAIAYLLTYAFDQLEFEKSKLRSEKIERKEDWNALPKR
jgi:hypothetical protein